MESPYKHQSSGLESFWTDSNELTPNDSNDVEWGESRGFIVRGNAGDVRVMTVSGSVRTIPNVQASEIITVRIKRVYATGTTATGIWGGI